MTVPAKVRPLVLPMCLPDEPTVVLHACGPSGLFLPIAALLDTGSDMTLLTTATGRALGVPLKDERNKGTTVTTVAGEPIRYFPALLHLAVDCGSGPPICVTVRGGMTSMLSRDLIGRDFLRQFDFCWKRRSVELRVDLEESS